MAERMAYLVLLGATVLFLLPFFWMISTSINIVGAVLSCSVVACGRARFRGESWIAHMNQPVRAADSLPALVGALTGALCAVACLPPGWGAVVAEAPGRCPPFKAGTNLALTARRLLELARA